MTRLYGRNPPPGVKKCTVPLKLQGEYPDYRTAVVRGRELFGHGNFTCEKMNGPHTPTREEQLLQDKWNPRDLNYGIS